MGTQLINKRTHFETKVYVKSSNTDLLLHYESHGDALYKRVLLKNYRLGRAFRLSSNWRYFSEVRDRLKVLFSRLKYPAKLVNSTISWFVAIKALVQFVS